MTHFRPLPHGCTPRATSQNPHPKERLGAIDVCSASIQPPGRSLGPSYAGTAAELASTSSISLSASTNS
eukprot:4056825-Prorocentrum_lima.AAC.1